MKGTTFLRSVTKKSRKYLRLDHTWSLELRVHPSVDKKKSRSVYFQICLSLRTRRFEQRFSKTERWWRLPTEVSSNIWSNSCVELKIKKNLKKGKKNKKFNFINSQFTGYQMWSWNVKCKTCTRTMRPKLLNLIPVSDA